MKQLPSGITVVLLGVSFGGGLEKPPGATLEDDWKVLVRLQWTNPDPTKAWDQLDEKWKKLLEANGVKAWSNVGVAFLGGGNGREDGCRIGWRFYAAVDGKDKVEQSADTSWTL
jgi:hypothetical protein